MTITEFLLARIAEDEKKARAASSPDEAWRFDEGYTYSPADRLNARYNPARVLAECGAKRAIVERHVEYLYTDDEPGFSMVMWDCMCPRLTGKPCPTIGSLAAIYADHADYRQEWTL